MFINNNGFLKTDMVFTKLILVSYICFVLIVLSTVIPINFYHAFGSRQCAKYDDSLNIVTIFCDMKLSSLSNTSNNNELIQEESPGVWLLKASIKVSPEASIEIGGDDIKWLKMGGGDNTTTSIVISGSADFQNVKITSWNPKTNSVISQNTNGSIVRPYILADTGSQKVNIRNSELADLGFNQFPSNGLVFSHGGAGSIIQNSTFHEMWDGFFSNGVSSVNIMNNTYHDNYRYGIDIHSASHNVTVSNNIVYNNTKAGISASQDCTKIIFNNNNVSKNRETGLMFSLNTRNSTMSNNIVTSETVGISIYSSQNNTLKDNKIISSLKPILISGNSTNVQLVNNTDR